MSALPRKADLTGSRDERPLMTQSGHRAQNRLVFPAGAPSAREMAIGQGFPSPYQPDKGRSAIYRTDLGPDSCWYAPRATIVGNRGKPFGESRMNTFKPTRREFLKAMGTSAATVSMSAMPVFAQPPLGKFRKPNVLFIIIDDLNDWIGPLGGHPQAQTPNLDRLCGRGVLFTNAHCPAPACNPSRTAVMWGIRPSKSGVYVNKNWWAKSKALQGAVSLPEHFRTHGYEVIGSGKIYHDYWPELNAWDQYKTWGERIYCGKKPTPLARPDSPIPRRDSRPQHGCEKLSRYSDRLDWGGYACDEEMGDWKVADWAIQELARNREEPFFLACGFFRPHLTWYVPKKYFNMYPAPHEIMLPMVKKPDKAGFFGDRLAYDLILGCKVWNEAVRAYLACISFVDTCVGRVIRALDKSPYSQNTIVVLWSDHGFHLGEKLVWRKGTLWEESTRVPLMFIAPGVTRLGGRCKAPVNLIDIYPTLVDLCKLPPVEFPEQISSGGMSLRPLSLKPLLENPSSSWDRPSLTTWKKGNHALRTERWRYIRYKNGREELYDHKADPLEWDNLARDRSYDGMKVAGIKKRLKQWLPDEDAPKLVEENCFARLIRPESKC